MNFETTGVIVLVLLGICYVVYDQYKKNKSYDSNSDLVSSYRNHKARDLKMRKLRAQYNLGIRSNNFSFLEKSVKDSPFIDKVENNVIHVDFSSRKRKTAS